MLIHISGGSKGTANASLTRTLQAGTYCLTFWYSVYRNSDSIQVTATSLISPSETHILWEASGSTQSKWKFAKVEVFSHDYNTFSVSIDVSLFL